VRFAAFAEVVETFCGKRVVVVGSGPSVLQNKPGEIDAHDVVVRVNNYRTNDFAGRRTDIHYSFYGTSIKKTAAELKRDGVKLCLAKCPDSKPIASAWHESNGKQAGIDFRYIYNLRRDWWPCPVYVPGDERFLAKFALLDQHIPTTGFAAILDVLECEPQSVLLTGFDFFSSGIHNVNERWKPGNPNDPIGHRPDLEKEWLRQNLKRYPIRLDRALRWQLVETATRN
jgi:hypothetical protein